MGSDEKDIYKLKSSNISETFETLHKIQKCYFQNHAEMNKIEKNSLVESVVSLIEHPKFCNITLNIIADGCLELDFVNEVIKSNGIKCLIRIMNSNLNDGIKNKACCALSNMAKFETGYKAVHLMKPISSVVSFLSETSDVDCQQTAIYTLMVLGKCSKTKELISRENGFTCIVKLLKSPNIKVLICSIKALAKLTYNCNIACAHQLLFLDCHKVLIKLHSHSEKEVRNYSLMSLKNLSSFEELRTELVKVGAVNLFVEVLSASELHEKSQYAVLALCKYLDHIHMWDHNGTDRATGLKALLDVLKKKQFQDIHICVVASLIPLSYEFSDTDFSNTDILLNLDVLQVLIEILNNFINVHKCKFADRCMYNKHSDCKLNNGSEMELVNDPSYEKQSENDLLKDNKHVYSFENVLKVSSEKQHDAYFLKSGNKYDSSIYGLSSATSDYCGSCSPNRLCSPIHKYSSSPEYNYDIDVGSPSVSHNSSGVWSPVSLSDENMSHHLICWSPVLPNYSISESEKNEATLTGDFSLVDNFNSSVVSTDSSLLESYSVSERKNISKLKNSDHEPSDFSESMASRKKFKTSPMHISTPVKLQMNVKPLNTNIASNSENNINNSHPDKASKVSSKFSAVMNKKSKVKKDLVNSVESKSVFDDDEQLSDLKLLNENGEQQTIDQYVILFILQLSFHCEKRKNSQMANKSFFSILIDYLCLIHKPSLKGETVLLNLIKNRYCLEKIIANGFFCELEEKMKLQNYSCTHHYNVKQLYSKLINLGRQEIESDFGIGALSHIIMTSEKNEQLHGICTLSKLVSKNVSLHKLLLNINGLSILLNFLHESDIKTRKKAVFSLCQLYQSLTKQQKPEKCCFKGTCAMKISTECFYRESFLNVTFSVKGGGKILANREKICENSMYFQALLEGYFKESNAGLVKFPAISAENLSTIFHFLHGCGNGNFCPYIKRIPLSVLLELLRDCDFMLLNNIKSFVEDQLCHQLSPSVIPSIYKKAKIHNYPALARKTLCSALSIDSSQKDLMWGCFEELLKLESADIINYSILNADIINLFKKLLL